MDLNIVCENQMITSDDYTAHRDSLAPHCPQIFLSLLSHAQLTKPQIEMIPVAISLIKICAIVHYSLMRATNFGLYIRPLRKRDSFVYALLLL